MSSKRRKPQQPQHIAQGSGTKRNEVGLPNEDSGLMQKNVQAIDFTGRKTEKDEDQPRSTGKVQSCGKMQADFCSENLLQNFKSAELTADRTPNENWLQIQNALAYLQKHQFMQMKLMHQQMVGGEGSGLLSDSSSQTRLNAESAECEESNDYHSQEFSSYKSNLSSCLEKLYRNKCLFCGFKCPDAEQLQSHVIEHHANSSASFTNRTHKDIVTPDMPMKNYLYEENFHQRSFLEDEDQMSIVEDMDRPRSYPGANSKKPEGRQTMEKCSSNKSDYGTYRPMSQNENSPSRNEFQCSYNKEDENACSPTSNIEVSAEISRIRSNYLLLAALGHSAKGLLNADASFYGLAPSVQTTVAQETPEDAAPIDLSKKGSSNSGVSAQRQTDLSSEDEICNFDVSHFDPQPCNSTSIWQDANFLANGQRSKFESVNGGMRAEEDDWEAMMEVTSTDEMAKVRQLVGGRETKLTDPNQCMICDRILSCKSALQMHYRTHTGTRPFKCKVCQRAFTTKGNLKTHMGVHRTKLAFRPSHQCPVCHKRFTNSLVLQQHIRHHLIDGQNNALIANGQMKPQEALKQCDESTGQNRHILKAEKSPLEQCDGFSIKTEPLTDKKKVIPNECEGKNTANHDNLKHSPEACNKSVPKFSFPPILTEHTDGSLNFPHFLNFPLFPLNFQSNFDRSKANFLDMRHMLQEQTVEQLRGGRSPGAASLGSPASNPYAPVMGPTPMQMAAMMSGRPNTTCNICFKVFACYSALEIHYRSHTKERPFKCDICFRGFSTKGNMKQHLLTHKIRDGPQTADQQPSVSHGPYPFTGPHQQAHSQQSTFFGPFAGPMLQCLPAMGLSDNSQSGRGLITEPLTECHWSKVSDCEENNLESHNDQSESRQESIESANLMSSADSTEKCEKNLTPNPLESIQKMWDRTETVSMINAISGTSEGVENLNFDGKNYFGSQSACLNGGKHQCHLCYKNFSSASALQIHMRTHTGDRPFSCKICTRAFTTKGNLKVHMGTHMWTTTNRRGRRIFDTPHHSRSTTGVDGNCSEPLLLSSDQSALSLEPQTVVGNGGNDLLAKKRGDSAFTSHQKNSPNFLSEFSQFASHSNGRINDDFATTSESNLKKVRHPPLHPIVTAFSPIEQRQAVGSALNGVPPVPGFGTGVPSESSFGTPFFPHLPFFSPTGHHIPMSNALDFALARQAHALASDIPSRQLASDTMPSSTAYAQHSARFALAMAAGDAGRLFQKSQNNKAPLPEKSTHRVTVMETTSTQRATLLSKEVRRDAVDGTTEPQNHWPEREGHGTNDAATTAMLAREAPNLPHVDPTASSLEAMLLVWQNICWVCRKACQDKSELQAHLQHHLTVADESAVVASTMSALASSLDENERKVPLRV